MPLSESLHEDLLQRLRSRRRELAQALNSRLHDDGLDTHDEAALPRRSGETDDDGSAETQRAQDVAHLSRVAAELTQVDAALARAASGSLGECQDCGEPIAPARLQANPAAARCAECQQYVEHVSALARLTRA